jgi:hypothetical protein
LEVDVRRVQFLAKVEGEGAAAVGEEAEAEPVAAPSAGESAPADEDIPF